VITGSAPENALADPPHGPARLGAPAVLVRLLAAQEVGLRRPRRRGRRDQAGEGERTEALPRDAHVGGVDGGITGARVGEAVEHGHERCLAADRVQREQRRAYLGGRGERLGDAADARGPMPVMHDLAALRAGEGGEWRARAEQRRDRADFRFGVAGLPALGHGPEERGIDPQVRKKERVPPVRRRQNGGPQPVHRRAGRDQGIAAIAVSGLVPDEQRQDRHEIAGRVAHRRVKTLAAPEMHPPRLQPGRGLERRGARVAPPQGPMLLPGHARRLRWNPVPSPILNERSPARSTRAASARKASRPSTRTT